MAWNVLLMWGIFTSLTVADDVRDECPHPPQIDFASFATQIYMKGTFLECSCKPGYDRREGTPLFIVCEAKDQHLSWSEKCQCKVKTPGSHEEQNVTSAPSNPGKQTSTENRLSTYNLTSHCKEPVPWKHANEKKSYQFVVGQTLQYQCLETVKYGGTAESTCMLIHGKPAWTKPHLKCTNDTSTEILQPSFTTEHKIAVAACVFLINLIIFLVWIIWRKRWRRRRQHDKEKNKNREVRSYGKNQVADHPIGLLSA